MNRPSLHPELAPVLVEALRRSEKPLSVIALRKQIYPPFRFSERDRRPVEELLAEQAKEGRIYEWPRYRRQRQFWTEQPEEFAARAIIRRLERGACSRTALEKDVRGKLHGFPKSRWPQFIKRLLDEGRIFQNPPWKTKGRTKLQASPPDPEPYLKKLVPELRKLVERFVALRVSPQPWVDEVWGNGPEKPPGDLPQRILAAIERLEPNPGAGVTCEDLRSAPEFNSVGKEAFDRAVVELIERGAVSPHRHSGPFRLSENDRDQLVYDGGGNYYVALVRI